MATTLRFSDSAGKLLSVFDVTDDWSIVGGAVQWPAPDATATDQGEAVLVTASLVGGGSSVTVKDSTGEHRVEFDRSVTSWTLEVKTVTPPPAPTRPQLPPPPSGWKSSLLWDFGAAPLPRPLRVRTGVQGGTESASTAENVVVDPTVGLRLITRAKPTGGQLYGSAYVDIGSGVNADRLPLFGRTLILARWPLHFSSFACAGWLNYKGSAAKFEIDAGEWFVDQAPGCVRFQVHSPNHYGKNLIRGNGGTDAARTTIPYSPHPTPKPVVSGAFRVGGVQDYTCDDGTGSKLPGHTGWHLIEVERRRVTVGSGWKLGLDFYLDGKLMVTWTETLPAGRTTPPWYEPGDDAHSWDFRADAWVGGEGRSRASNPVGKTRIYTYDGKQKDGSTSYLRPVGQVPNADLWIANEDATYELQIAAIRELSAS